jgi:colanic acid/amylovoran biosynthesis glycosyltransferase
LLVEEHDVDGMAKNMIWVLDNPEKAHEMGERGQKHIKEHFSLDKHLQILTKAVTDAAAKCSINEE